MKSFLSYIAEKREQFIWTSTYKRDGKTNLVPGLENPTLQELIHFVRKTSGGDGCRFIVQETGKLYLWSSKEPVLHFDVITGEGLYAKKLTAGQIFPPESNDNDHEDDEDQKWNVDVLGTVGVSNPDGIVMKNRTMRQLKDHIGKKQWHVGRMARDYKKGGVN